MTGSFISKQDSPFYSSNVFHDLLQYVKLQPKGVRMKEGNSKLMLIFEPIGSVTDGINALSKIKKEL